MSNNEVWTDWNERQYIELKGRRDRIRNANRAVVVDLARRLLKDAGISQVMPPPTFDNFVSSLIDNADALNDALKPFDSGVRAVVAEERSPPPAPSMPIASLKRGDPGFWQAVKDGKASTRFDDWSGEDRERDLLFPVPLSIDPMQRAADGVRAEAPGIIDTTREPYAFTRSEPIDAD